MYEALGKFFVGLLFIPLNVLVRGYTISWLWLWFIVPIWNWQPLSIGQAIGLSVISSTLTSSIVDRKIPESERYSAIEYALIVLVSNLFVLLYGYILHQFI